jgi:hypothetical protein
MTKKEYAKRCERCFKYKQARLYPFKLFTNFSGHSRYLYLCKECWEEQNAADKNVSDKFEAKYE